MKEKKNVGKPTKHMPGSPEKIKALEQRAQNKQPLFHPEDGKPSNDADLMRRLEKYVQMFEESDD